MNVTFNVPWWPSVASLLVWGCFGSSLNSDSRERKTVLRICMCDCVFFFLLFFSLLRGGGSFGGKIAHFSPKPWRGSVSQLQVCDSKWLLYQKNVPLNTFMMPIRPFPGPTQGTVFQINEGIKKHFFLLKHPAECRSGLHVFSETMDPSTKDIFKCKSCWPVYINMLHLIWEKETEIYAAFDCGKPCSVSLFLCL